MEKFPSNYSHNLLQAAGLTLIEVMIALSIVGIALTAVIKATSQNIRSTTYLQSKSEALWVGQEVMNEARVGVITLPNAPDSLKQKTLMLGQDWYWQAALEDTPNKRIKKVTVQVYQSDPEENTEARVLISLESYLYHEEA